MIPTPTAIRTIPRRRSYHGRNPVAAETAAGVESNAGGIGWPFSTIIRTVRCNERVLAQLLNMMTATIATGKPNTVSRAMATSGTTSLGISPWSPSSDSASFLSFPSMVIPNLPCLNLCSTRCLISSANWFAAEGLAEVAGEMDATGATGAAVAASAGVAAGASGVGAGVCA